MAYELPALFPGPIRVEHPLKDGEAFEWKGFKLMAFDFPGQTLYHDGLLVERDGYKVFFTDGDCFSNRSFSDVCSQNRNFSGRDVGFEKCCRILLETKPDILMAAHWGPMPMDIEKFIDHLQAREKLYEKLFPYDNVNFGTDPRWIRVYQFRQQASSGAPVEIKAHVLNHAAKPHRVRIMLALQPGWTAIRTAEEQTVAARTEAVFPLSATAPTTRSRRRFVLGLSVVVDGKPLGEFSSAVVDLAPVTALSVRLFRGSGQAQCSSV
jgi:hypothetical protein